MTNDLQQERDRTIYLALVAAADKGLPCPDNAVLACRAGYKSISGPPASLDRLVKRGHIVVERFGASRIVTISKTGKSTAGERGKPHFSAGVNHIGKASVVRENIAKRQAQQPAAAANIPAPPPTIDWAAAFAEQDAKPASERWPYAQPTIVERAFMPSRPATHVPSQSSLA